MDDGSHPPKDQPDVGNSQARKMSPKQYILTRIPTLKPTLTHVANPITLLRMLNTQQWLFFLVAFLGWTWDSFDFFTVSLTIEELAEEFDRTAADITWGITLVLMLRTVGSVLFGIAADRWGRKWPFVVNNVLFILLEGATGFCGSYKSFLAVRALFGIAMGGLYGNAAATGEFRVSLLGVEGEGEEDRKKARDGGWVWQCETTEEEGDDERGRGGARERKRWVTRDEEMDVEMVA